MGGACRLPIGAVVATIYLVNELSEWIEIYRDTLQQSS